MKELDFIAMLAPAAMASMHATRIPASFVIAEGFLESGYGNSELAVQALNLFGVKAGPTWHGATLTMRTREHLNGVDVIVPAIWRRYVSLDDCVSDHAAVLLHDRYKPAFLHCDDANAFTDAVAAAGYATDEHYAIAIKKLIHQYNLTQYDKPSASAA